MNEGGENASVLPLKKLGHGIRTAMAVQDILK